MSNEQLPCINCITLPVCMATAQRDKNLTWMDDLRIKCSLMNRHLIFYISDELFTKRVDEMHKFFIRDGHNGE